MFFRKKTAKQPLHFQLSTDERVFLKVDAALLTEQLSRMRSLQQLPVDGDYGFLILQPDQPIHNCEYVQMACSHGKNDCDLEARIQSKKGPHQYHTDTTDFDLISSVFHQFLEGKVPNVSGWEDLLL